MQWCRDECVVQGGIFEVDWRLLFFHGHAYRIHAQGRHQTGIGEYFCPATFFDLYTPLILARYFLDFSVKGLSKSVRAKLERNTARTVERKESHSGHRAGLTMEGRRGGILFSCLVGSDNTSRLSVSVKVISSARQIRALAGELSWRCEAKINEKHNCLHSKQHDIHWLKGLSQELYVRDKQT